MAADPGVRARWWTRLALMVLLQALLPTCLSKPKDEYHNLDGYGYSVIHEEIVKDSARTEAYRSAILENKSHFEGKVVADLGCGLGLMSLFSAEAGARKVYCIEGSQIASTAETIIRRNRKSDTVTVIKGRIEEAVIPEGEVDVIVSEWMGYFLHYEDMLPAILTFRDKYLADNGLIFPSHARMWLSLYSDTRWYNDRISYWKDVYGFDYTPIVSRVVEEQFVNPERQHLREDGVVSEPSLVHSVDMYTATLEDVKDIRATISSKVTRKATIHGIAFWFDVTLEGDEHSVLLDTAPKAGYTSWSQVVWYLQDAFNATEGDDVKGTFAMMRTDRGEFDVAVRLKSPSRVELEAFDQSPSTMFQNLYERLSFEHGIYEEASDNQLHRLLDYASRLQLGFVAAGVSAFVLGWMVGQWH